MKKASVILLVLGAALAAGAQTNLQTQSMSLDDCVRQALEHNFDVRIERYNPQISRYDLSAAYGGYDPTFSISGQHDYSESGGNVSASIPGTKSDANSFSSSVGGLLPFGTTYNLFGNISETYGNARSNSFDGTGGRVGINLTQPLLKNFWIDGTRLNIRVAKNRLKYSEQGLRLRMIGVVTLVEQAYYDLIAARENVKVQQSALELAERLLAENKKRVEVGSMAPLDQKQAESQLASSRADLISAQRAVTAQENVLKSLLSEDYRKIHDIDIEPAEGLTAPVMIFNLQDSWSKGMTQRSDLQQAKLDLERQGIQLKYDRNQLFPELDLFGTYGHGANSADVVEFSDGFNQFRTGDRPFYTYGAQLSIPLSNIGPRNRYKATKLSAAQAVLVFKKLEQGVLIQIDDGIKQAQSNYERVDATRAAREYAEAALDAEQKKLASGKSTSFFVLQLQKDLTAARSAEIAALADYNKSLAALAQVEGTTLDRRGINVRVEK
jgi:outer membrane protein TolC